MPRRRTSRQDQDESEDLGMLPPIPVPPRWDVLKHGCPECNRKDRLQLWIPAYDRWDIVFAPSGDHMTRMRELVAIENPEDRPRIVCGECLLRRIDVPPHQVESLMWADDIKWEYGH